MRIKTNVAQFSHTLIVLGILTAVVFYGQGLLKPIAFAVILSFLLKPICDALERKKFPAVLAIITTFIMISIFIGAIITLFSANLMNLFDDMRNFGQTITQVVFTVQEMIIHNLPISAEDANQLVAQGKQALLEFTGSLLAPTLESSGNFLGSLGLTIVYAFFFLLYRKSIRMFFMIFFEEAEQLQASQFLHKVTQVLNRYFVGLLIVIGIMGILNTLGLWVIGVPNALLFGFFAALLTIIPYIGTWIGGALPVLFTLLISGNGWDALYVGIWFMIVQTIEANYITPKVLGNQVSVNPLFAFFALIIGGLLWGIAGMILFIPFVAVLKVICDHIPEFRSIGILLGNEFSSRHTDEPEKFSDTVRKFFDR
jgi:predicted PurR-regulated permease PerM